LRGAIWCLEREKGNKVNFKRRNTFRGERGKRVDYLEGGHRAPFQRTEDKYRTGGKKVVSYKKEEKKKWGKA